MINIVKKYLEKNHHSDKKESFEEFFLSHPNYPSIFAITDSFDMLAVENVAIKVPKQQFVELPDSFLALFKKELVLVSKNPSSVHIETEEGGKKNLSFNEFLTDWDEVIVVVEPSNKIDVKSERIKAKWMQYSLPVIALIVMSLIHNNFSLQTIALLLTSIAGLIVSLFIVQEKFGIKNEMVSKLCSMSSNTSCDSVINSHKADINKWLSFSDLPLLFFSISVLSILVQPKHSGLIVGFLSLLSVPVILYSIWLQKFELKKWCVLCLTVSFLILFQAFIFGITNEAFPNFLSIDFFGFLFSLVLFTSIWLFIKVILEEKTKVVSDVNELRKIKRNYAVFNFLTEEVPVISGFEKLEGLHFGSRNASLQLTIIISPSCGHCHAAFEQAYDLVSRFPEKVFLNVLFNVNPDNDQNPYRIVVERLLAINNQIPEKIEEAIIDWHIKKMGLNDWTDKWDVDFIDMKATHQIHQQYKWCMENQFNYTPVKMVNDRLFPKEYKISELKYFLNNFSEAKKAAV